MRILYLTNGFPYPLTSGYLRHYFFIRGLAERHDVSLLSIVGRSFHPEDALALAPFTSRVLTYGAPGGPTSGARRALVGMRSLAPGRGGGKAVREMRSAVARCLREERFDIVFFSGKQTFPVIAELRDIPIIADVCDATSMRVRGRMRHCSLGRLPLLGLEYLQTRIVERQLVQRASHLLFATSRDREALLGAATARTTIIPNGVDLAYWKRGTSARDKDTIVMTGAMDYAPNRDASLYLIEEILPRVRRIVPGTKLFIVGRDAPPALIRAGRAHDVCVTGLVADMRPYLERASVFAAPLRFGAGIQNKLLEAMAMGVPIVASPLAAEGLRTEEGKLPPVAVARTPDEYAEQIVRRLVDAEQDSTPDVEARRFVEQNFDWRKITERLEHAMTSLIGQRDR